MEATVLDKLRALSSDARVVFYRNNKIPLEECIDYEVALLKDSRNQSGAD